MNNKKNDEFHQFLTSISSVLSYNILKLYFNANCGFSLTETKEKLNESISTVQDHLKRLLSLKIIIKEQKTYVISNFGSFIFTELEKFKIINRVRDFFGQIPDKLIPARFLNELIPYLSDFEIHRTSVQFMDEMHEMMSKMTQQLETGKHNVKVLGWWSLKMDLDFLKTFYKDINLDTPSMEKLFESVDFKLILTENVVSEMLENEQIIKLTQQVDIFTSAEYIRILEQSEKFNFTIMKSDDYIGFFLIIKDDFDPKHFIIAQNNPGLEKFFNDLFDYYWERSIPLEQCLNKK